MHVDDEDCGGGTSLVTPPNSQTSSVDGVSAATNRNSHPFRIIEHDALSLQSLSSLGRVGRILGGISSDNGMVWLLFYTIIMYCKNWNSKIDQEKRNYFLYHCTQNTFFLTNMSAVTLYLQL